MSVGDGEDISLVIGGNGFIGSALVRHLDTNGRKVRVYDRGEPQAGRHGAGVHYLRGGLDDTAALDASMAGVGTVFHLASSTVPGTSNLDPAADVTTNLLGTLNVIDAMKRRGIRRLVFLSSGGTVYGRLKHCPVPEEHPTFPICSYGIVKLAIERYLHLYRELHGLEYTILRASNPYGPFQSTSGLQGAVPAFIAKMLQGKPIEVWGDGSVVRDFLFVDDLIRALIQGARMPSGVSGIYNVGSGIGTSLNELLSTLVRVSGLSDTRQYQPGRAYDVPTSVLDISRIKAELHWAPQTSLEEGLRRTLDWLKHDNATTGGSIALSNPKNIAP